VALGSVAIPDRRRQASLRPVGGGLGERRGRDENDSGSFTNGAKRCIEARRTATDDSNLGFERIQPQVRYLRMPRVFLAHPSSLEHETGAHPERPARITAIEQELARKNWLGFERIASSPVDRERLTAVHPESYVEAIERVSTAGGGALDPDTIVSAGSWSAALHAAGGAVRLVEMLLDGEADYGFSAHRPPGHHATRNRAMGFCLFNSVAVAARFALDVRGLDRVMILDWDVHHGNGTNDIFHATRQVLFVSIHESPLYPGTGPSSDLGSGDAKGFTVNLPVPGGSDDTTFRSLVDHVALPLLHEYEPQLVLVSAGYDAHREDPLATCRLTEDGFAEMTRSVRWACASAGAALGFVLEGGYALEALARSVAATLRELSHEVTAQPDETPVVPLARQARKRLAEWWPSSGS
jgi:acetoin utilization deacetylase AcuC-like enzyme